MWPQRSCKLTGSSADLPALRWSWLPQLGNSATRSQPQGVGRALGTHVPLWKDERSAPAGVLIQPLRQFSNLDVIFKCCVGQFCLLGFLLLWLFQGHRPSLNVHLLIFLAVNSELQVTRINEFHIRNAEWKKTNINTHCVMCPAFKGKESCVRKGTGWLLGCWQRSISWPGCGYIYDNLWSSTLFYTVFRTYVIFTIKN